MPMTPLSSECFQRFFPKKKKDFFFFFSVKICKVFFLFDLFEHGKMGVKCASGDGRFDPLDQTIDLEIVKEREGSEFTSAPPLTFPQATRPSG